MTPPTTYRYQPSEDIMYHFNKDDRERFPSRKHPRLKKFNYSSPNYYFITICTWEKRHLFGNANHLNYFGRIAADGIQNIQNHFPQVMVDKAVVMPNHVHMIIVLQSDDISISTIIGLYKSFVSRQIHLTHPTQKIWQASFHDHVIRDQQSYEKIWLYIHANPDNWKKDCFYSENQT